MAEWTGIHVIDEILVSDYEDRLELHRLFERGTRVCGGPCDATCSFRSTDLPDVFPAEWNASENELPDLFKRAHSNVERLTLAASRLEEKDVWLKDMSDYSASMFYQRSYGSMIIDCRAPSPSEYTRAAISERVSARLAKQDEEFQQIVTIADRLGVNAIIRDIRN